MLISLLFCMKKVDNKFGLRNRFLVVMTVCLFHFVAMAIQV